jgi:UDP-2,3-diacylglucosamine hydrolase
MQLFISDLHLCATRPETTAAFERFMSTIAPDAETLWILGDLFEYWAGDDDLESEFNRQIADRISVLVHQGVAVRIIVGNRDFLLSKAFSEYTGANMEAETVTLDIAGKRVVLTHGDAQCTDDMAYQQFRAMVRNPVWQSKFLTQPLAVRRQIAEQLRTQSEANKGGKPSGWMDVNAEAVIGLFREYTAQTLIHGHTHLPALHLVDVDGKQCQRWVLADWHDKATWLESGPDGFIARNEP